MKGQYGFYHDADSCTGCGTCALACQDKHDLPPGLKRRRVLACEGGAYQRQGKAWGNSVYAFYLSVSCHHCQAPPCTAACPEGALWKREEDGLVLLDREKCTGCGECLSSCPFDAIYCSSHDGRAGKCDGCPDLLAVGKLPACVAACPMRVLDFGSREALCRKYPHAVPYHTFSTAAKEIACSTIIKPHRNWKDKLSKAWG